MKWGTSLPDPKDIKWIIEEYHKQFYIYIFDNLGEEDQFLGK